MAMWGRMKTAGKALLLAGGLCLAGAGLAMAQPVDKVTQPAIEILDPQISYTADFWFSDGAGNRQRGVVHHVPGRERREVTMRDGSRQVLLVRRDEGQAYLLMPNQRWYLGLGYEAAAQLAGGLETMTITRRAIGPDEVDGVPATRYEATGEGPQGRFTGDLWLSEEGILLQAAGSVTVDGRVKTFETGLTNLRKGSVQADLFDLPDGWSGLQLRNLSPEQIEQAVRMIAMMNSRR
ncbi:hypothetical protein [Telmatospirillum sp. J64-1]|uniref:hypothetical protein n=1 Tax=Telmatospirillum sp. J64-1 TaxID=2502183 RepID=UPI001C8F2870|nr:hypothetical protein [Telmatospirillum sp. J64-1]